MAPYNILFLSSEEAVRRWQAPLAKALPGERLFWLPGDVDPTAVDIVLTEVPPPGALTPYGSLKLIQSLWMGVETLLADATLPPDVPLARMIEPHMTRSMVESVLAHVLSAHLQFDEYARFQHQARWKMLQSPIAEKRRVGILGLGELGRAACAALRGLGFQLAGWSRTPRRVEGVECFAGAAGRDAFLRRSEILVVLLPLTPETRGLIDARFLAQLPDGAVLINLARGALVEDDDLLNALDAGRLRHAVLDVFNVEPLPPEHRYWSHPRVSVTPHIAALTDPKTASAFVAENVRRMRAGEPLLGIVDRERGY
jgi:glyoxylate/hydroxypyruvate reductase A